jgi:hypothetical protein
MQVKEAEMLEQERLRDALQEKKTGRPKKYKSKLNKTVANEVKSKTVACNNARQRLPQELVDPVYRSSTDFGERDREKWHGLRTFITDGTYIQLQDTEDIKEACPVLKEAGSYPQALLFCFLNSFQNSFN